MVLFIDLEDESEPPEQLGNNPHHWLMHDNTDFLRGLTIGNEGRAGGVEVARENPNKNAITEALGCYPYV